MRESLPFSSVVRLLSGFFQWCVTHASVIFPVAMSVLYFAYGFSQIHEYGVSWDEPLHRNWGELFTFFWSSGDRSFLESMPGFGIHYGPLFYTANFILSEWLLSHDYLSFVAANHVLTLLSASVSVGLTFVLGRLIGGVRIGFIAAVAFVLYPQLLAHAHYNPKDIPLMGAVLLTGIIFVVALKRGSVWLLLLSAFLMGVSISVKITALLMLPAFGLTYFFWVACDTRSFSIRTFRIQGLTIVAAALSLIIGTFLFWPSAWGDPFLVLRSVSFFLTRNFWAGKVLYFGKEYGGLDLPWHYTVFEFFAATPALLVVGFIVGLLTILYQLTHKKLRIENLFLFLWVLLPLLYTLKSGVVRYDGIRQFFFVLPAMCVLMALGIDVGFRRLKNRSLQIVMALFFVAYLVFQISIIHPYEGSYRNEVLQFLYPSRMDEQFDLEYWGATYKEGMDWLDTYAVADAVICVPIAEPLVLWYSSRDDFIFECSPETNYVLFFTRHRAERTLASRAPVFTIDRLGARLLSIYQLK